MMPFAVHYDTESATMSPCTQQFGTCDTTDSGRNPELVDNASLHHIPAETARSATEVFSS